MGLGKSRLHALPLCVSFCLLFLIASCNEEKPAPLIKVQFINEVSGTAIANRLVQFVLDDGVICVGEPCTMSLSERKSYTTNSQGIIELPLYLLHQRNWAITLSIPVDDFGLRLAEPYGLRKQVQLNMSSTGRRNWSANEINTIFLRAVPEDLKAFKVLDVDSGVPLTGQTYHLQVLHPQPLHLGMILSDTQCKGTSSETVLHNGFLVVPRLCWYIFSVDGYEPTPITDKGWPVDTDISMKRLAAGAEPEKLRAARAAEILSRLEEKFGQIPENSHRPAMTYCAKLRKQRQQLEQIVSLPKLGSSDPDAARIIAALGNALLKNSSLTANEFHQRLRLQAVDISKDGGNYRVEAEFAYLDAWLLAPFKEVYRIKKTGGDQKNKAEFVVDPESLKNSILPEVLAGGDLYSDDCSTALLLLIPKTSISENTRLQFLIATKRENFLTLGAPYALVHSRNGKGQCRQAYINLRTADTDHQLVEGPCSGLAEPAQIER